MNSAYALSAENILASLPSVLREDENLYALAAAISEALAYRTEEIRRVAIYPQMDALPEDLLDILANDFKVDWYDYDYDLEQKRRTLKDSFLVHRHLGTKFAVKTAISAIYPNTAVEEWFEYGGRPHAFRLHINVSGKVVSPSQHNRVLELVRYYKNLRSYLDEITYTLDAAQSATAHLGGSMASVVTLAIPAIENQFLFDDMLRTGGTVCSVATVHIPEAPDAFAFADRVRLGGGMHAIVSTPIPESRQTPVLEGSAHIAGKNAIISTMPLAEL